MALAAQSYHIWSLGRLVSRGQCARPSVRKTPSLKSALRRKLGPQWRRSVLTSLSAWSRSSACRSPPLILLVQCVSAAVHNTPSDLACDPFTYCTRSFAEEQRSLPDGSDGHQKGETSGPVTVQSQSSHIHSPVIVHSR
eukprot:6867664-Pyramimonas_sp.AAC.1